MLKVLIADDEPGVGRLIHALIEWKKLDMKSVGIVQDGEKAWEAILNEEPDIVITDIRMPLISGLDLVRMAAAEQKNIHFIIISGYRYFEYAHKALQYGVEDYLLKPIDEEALNQALEHIRQAHTEKCSLDRLQEDLQQSRAVLSEGFLKEVADSKRDISIQQELCRKYHVNLPGKFASAFWVRVDRSRQTPRSRLQETAIRDDLLRIIWQECDKLEISAVAAAENGLNIPALFCWDPEQEKNIRELSHRLMQRLREYFSSYRDYVPTLGISRMDGQGSYYADVLFQAHTAADQRLLSGNNKRIKWENLPCCEMTAEKILHQYKDPYLRAVEAMQEDRTREIVRECFTSAYEAGMLGADYYDLSRNMLQLMLDGVTNGHAELEERRVEWHELLYNMPNLNQLQGYLMEQIGAYMEEYQKRRANEDSRPVREAMQYIQVHYSEKIQMDELAAQFYFTPSYFSELFKKKTGKTFTDYLTEVRMNNAKQLLRDSSLPVRLVAEKVGYKDVKYFSQQFMRLVGIKPSEYRRLYQ